MANRGLFGVIEDTMTSPLWLGGAALLSGEGFGGALRGMQLGAGFRQQRRQQEEEEAARQRFRSLFENGGLSGIDPAFSRLAQAVGPQEGAKILADALLAKMRADRAAASGGRAGLQVIYGVDEQGNPVALQPTDTGQLVRSQMPAGVTISREPLRFDAGTHFVLMDPITRQQIGIIPKATEEEAASRARGQELGKAEGAARAGYEDAVSKAQLALSTIQKIKDHPARERMTGWSSYLPTVTPSGRGFQALLGQLEGQVFLEAYSGLRGGGHITEIEGEKAQRALARLDTAQSEEEFVQALDDLASVIRAGMQRAAKKAGVSTPQTEQRATRYRYNPATGELEPAQ
jgi:hypothetical protein